MCLFGLYLCTPTHQIYSRVILEKSCPVELSLYCVSVLDVLGQKFILNFFVWSGRILQGA